jgi:hypothetical protein
MRYVRYALFSDMEEARSALHDIENAGVPKGEVVLILHQNKLSQDEEPQASEGDGRWGLLVGILTGAVVGLLFSLLLAKLVGLPNSMWSFAMFGLFGGMLIGGLGGGLYGMGLGARPLERLERLWRQGNVLITAEIEGAKSLSQIENIFKKHHAVVATS